MEKNSNESSTEDLKAAKSLDSPIYNIHGWRIKREINSKRTINSKMSKKELIGKAETSPNLKPGLSKSIAKRKSDRQDPLDNLISLKKSQQTVSTEDLKTENEKLKSQIDGLKEIIKQLKTENPSGRRNSENEFIISTYNKFSSLQSQDKEFDKMEFEPSNIPKVNPNIM